MDFEQLPLFAAKPQSLSVSQLNNYLKQLLESDPIVKSVWITGEISNLSRPASGHIYLTLKDSTAALRAVMWRSTAARLRIALQNGMAVEAHGSITVYERDGQYQLVIDTIRAAGEGFLYLEFMRLKAQLEAEGLFDEVRKRPIPPAPQRIGIVTSSTGAALQDMLNILRQRYPLAEVFLAPAAVQGEAAPNEIIAALDLLNRTARPDVILLGRGGGSLEDLWAFNDPGVVRAVANSPIPIITGIGHETDFTLCDFASDLRAPTPTAAAVLATPDIAEIKTALQDLQQGLLDGVDVWLKNQYELVKNLSEQIQRSSPLRQIQSEGQHLDNLTTRLDREIFHHLQNQHTRWTNLQQQLALLNPLAILHRGYAIVQDSSGQIITSVSQTTSGQDITVQVSDGSFQATVFEEQ